MYSLARMLGDVSSVQRSGMRRRVGLRLSRVALRLSKGRGKDTTSTLHTSYYLLRRHDDGSDHFAEIQRAAVAEGYHGDHAPIPLTLVLEAVGIDETLWALQAVLPEEEWGSAVTRLLACDYAEHVAHLWFASEGVTWKPADTIEIARRYAHGNATRNELVAARDAARTAAGVVAAAGSVTQEAADAAAYDAAQAASKSAAWDAADPVHKSAAWHAGFAAGDAETRQHDPPMMAKDERLAAVDNEAWVSAVRYSEEGIDSPAAAADVAAWKAGYAAAWYPQGPAWDAAWQAAYKAAWDAAFPGVDRRTAAYGDGWLAGYAAAAAAAGDPRDPFDRPAVAWEAAESAAQAVPASDRRAEREWQAERLSEALESTARQ